MKRGGWTGNVDTETVTIVIPLQLIHSVSTCQPMLAIWRIHVQGHAIG